MFEPWSVYAVHCSNIDPPKTKYCVCFSANPTPLFFFINTFPNFSGIGQIPIRKGEHTLIMHDSFLDLSGARRVEPEDLTNAVDHGRLPQRVLDDVETSLQLGIDTLSERHRRMALDTFR